MPKKSNTIDYALIGVGLCVLYLTIRNLATVINYWYIGLLFVLFFFGLYDYNHGASVKSIIKNCMLFFGTIFFCFILLEIGLYVTGFDETNWFGVGSATGDFYDSLQPNEWGLRGPLPDTSTDAPPLVALLGDSFVLGAGVSDDSAIFSALMREKFQGEYQFLNLGLAGFNTVAQTALFKRAYQRTPFDKVVLFYFINDAEENPYNDYSSLFYTNFIPGEFGKALYDTSRAYYFIESRLDRMLERFNIRPSYNDYLHYIYKEAEYIKTHREVTTTFLNSFTPGSIMVVIIPVLSDLDNYEYEYAHEYITSIAESANVPVIDLRDAFAGMNEQDLIIGSYDYHFSEKGHQVVADYLSVELVKRGFLN